MRSGWTGAGGDQDRRGRESRHRTGRLAGTFSVPLQITVTQDADKKQVYAKTYTIQATADATSSGQFRFVADPIVVPMPTLVLANVYTITIGFEGGGAPRAPRRRTAG